LIKDGIGKKSGGHINEPGERDFSLSRSVTGITLGFGKRESKESSGKEPIFTVGRRETRLRGNKIDRIEERTPSTHPLSTSIFSFQGSSNLTFRVSNFSGLFESTAYMTLTGK